MTVLFAGQWREEVGRVCRKWRGPFWICPGVPKGHSGSRFAQAWSGVEIYKCGETDSVRKGLTRVEYLQVARDGGSRHCGHPGGSRSQLLQHTHSGMLFPKARVQPWTKSFPAFLEQQFPRLHWATVRAVVSAELGFDPGYIPSSCWTLHLPWLLSNSLFL